MSTRLRMEGIDAGYGKKTVLHGISLDVEPGEIVGIIGHNGAGKTTLVRAVGGLIPTTAGSIMFEQTVVTRSTAARRLRLGMAASPQDHIVFPHLTVLDNLKLGLFTDETSRTDFARVLELFPILRTKLGQKAIRMSGGQQRMLSIAMALAKNPSLLMLDEPSIGLAPTALRTIMETIRKTADAEGHSVLLVDQNVSSCVAVADRVYVLRAGEIILEETGEVARRRTDWWTLF
jgi:branched-chain amino acid transport system ATP-binding protein